MVFIWTLLPLGFLHLWWWRRWLPLFRFQLMLDLVLVAVLGPVLLGGHDLNPVRCLSRNAPFTAWQWNEETELQPTQSDLVLQFHPWWEQAQQRLADHRLPLVSTNIGGGLPLLANGQTGLWAPVMLPVWLLGPERGTTVMALWKLEAAALGAFLFLWRGWRLGWRAAALGGVAFGCSAYQVAWLLVPLAWVVAALPWAWWAAVLVLRRRASMVHACGFGAALGWLTGSGLHPETAVIVVGSTVLAGLVLHPKRWLRILVVVAVAVPVAAALSWPTIGYISASARQAVAVEQQPNVEPIPLSIRLAAARQVLLPAVNGHPGRGDWRQDYPHAAGATGIGAVALAMLAVGGVRRRHRRLMWAALAALAAALVLAYRVPPLDHLLVRMPPFDRMTLHRFAVLVPWSLAVCGALAVEGAQHGRRRLLVWRPLFFGFLVAVAVAAAAWTLAVGDVLLVLMSMAAAAAVLLSSGRGRWLVPLATLELALLAVGVNPVAAAADRLPRPAMVEQLIHRHELEPGRVMGLGGVLPANLGGRFGLQELRAYDPLRPLPFARLMAALGEPEPILGGSLQRAPAGFCGAWSVRYLATPVGERPAGWDLAWTNSEGKLWRNPLWLPELRVVGCTEAVREGEWLQVLDEAVDHSMTAFVAAGAPQAAAARARLGDPVVSETRVRAELSCDGPCLVVLARPWAPGWRAEVDGERAEIHLTNIAAMGVMSPAGEHQVELSYNPWRW